MAARPPFASMRPVAALGLATMLAGCGGDDSGNPVDPDPDDCEGVIASAQIEATSGRMPIPRIGGAVGISVSAEDDCGVPLTTIERTEWSASDPSIVHARPSLNIFPDRVEEVPDRGTIIAEGFGSAVVEAQVFGPSEASTTTTLAVDVVRPDTRANGLQLLGGDSVSRPITDVWVHGDHAYSGTNVADCGTPDDPCSDLPGSLIVWSIAGGVPTMIDSVPLPGPKTNDVKVSPRGDYLVVSQELNAAQNGIVILDLADPTAPTVVTQYTRDLDHGVHNLWLENIDGTDYAFVANDARDEQGGVHVIDLTDPADPRTLAIWSGGDSFVHDVYVRDGLAFVSHWDAGLFIVDVGNGMAGGSPEAPVEVGSLVMSGGNTHNAWYWPERALVFVGEETFPTPSDTLDVGQLHVVDVADMSAPTEIATHRIPGETPHNFWLDEENEILYAAWYDRGVRAIDVSGELSGDLGTAGREVGFIEPSGSRGLSRIWAPQLHNGVLYLSDMIHGIWAVTPLE